VTPATHTTHPIQNALQHAATHCNTLQHTRLTPYITHRTALEQLALHYDTQRDAHTHDTQRDAHTHTYTHNLSAHLAADADKHKMRALFHYASATLCTRPSSASSSSSTSRMMVIPSPPLFSVNVFSNFFIITCSIHELCIWGASPPPPPPPSTLTGGKVAKLNKFSSAYQSANIQIFYTG